MATKKSTKSLNERIIHVKATSNIYSVTALIPERLAEKILTDIRDNFCKLKRKKKEWLAETLSVQTCIHNLTLF